MRIAVYAGTFDPITRGHLSVIERAAALFDELIVLVAVNPAKRPLFSIDERLQMIGEVTARFANVTSAGTTGYVVELAAARGAHYLVRGVRGATDVDAEIALAHANRALAPDIETVFIPAHPELSEVSATRLKQLACEGTDISRYCPPAIAERLIQRLRQEATSRAAVPHV